MEFGMLFLACTVIWCVFQIPFPTALRSGKARALAILGSVSLILAHQFPLAPVEEIWIDPAAVLLWGIALGCALRWARRHIVGALGLAAAIGGLLVLLERMQPPAHIGLFSGVVIAAAALLLWRSTAAAVLCAATAPVFASLFSFLYEWASVGYSVFSLLPLHRFDAQVTAVLLAVLASRAFAARPART